MSMSGCKRVPSRWRDLTLSMEEVKRKIVGSGTVKGWFADLDKAGSDLRHLLIEWVEKWNPCTLIMWACGQNCQNNSWFIEFLAFDSNLQSLVMTKAQDLHTMLHLLPMASCYTSQVTVIEPQQARVALSRIAIRASVFDPSDTSRIPDLDHTTVMHYIKDRVLLDILPIGRMLSSLLSDRLPTSETDVSPLPLSDSFVQFNWHAISTIHSWAHPCPIAAAVCIESLRLLKTLPKWFSFGKNSVTVLPTMMSGVVASSRDGTRLIWLDDGGVLHPLVNRNQRTGWLPLYSNYSRGNEVSRNCFDPMPSNATLHLSHAILHLLDYGFPSTLVRSEILPFLATVSVYREFETSFEERSQWLTK